MSKNKMAISQGEFSPKSVVPSHSGMTIIEDDHCRLALLRENVSHGGLHTIITPFNVQRKRAVTTVVECPPSPLFPQIYIIVSISIILITQAYAKAFLLCRYLNRSNMHNVTMRNHSESGRKNLF